MGERVQERLAPWVGEGEAEGLFGSVYGEEVGGFAGVGLGCFLAGGGSVAWEVRGEGRAPGSGVVAAGGVFDLYDFGAGGRLVEEVREVIVIAELVEREGQGG